MPGRTDDNTRLVYIIILNYRNWQDTIECLTSVFGLDYDHFRVIVIDNASGNDSIQHLVRWAGNNTTLRENFSFTQLDSRDLGHLTDPASFPLLTFIQNGKNEGFAGGNNVALRLLKDPKSLFWMLNPDITVEKNSLTELVNFAALHPERSITGVTLKFQAQKDKIHYYGGGRVNFNSATAVLITKPEDIPQLEYVSGGSLFTKVQALQDIGLFPEEYFLFWEETDWCYRARRLGYQVNVCTTAVCYDKVGTTIGRGYLAEYYYTRNGLLFLSRYKRNRIGLALALSVIRLLKKLASGQWGRAKGVYKGILAFMKPGSL
ncbi:glycosyltransferase family 2 protein [Flavitalea flava]